MPPLANASLTPPNDCISGAHCEYANKYKLHLLFQQMAVSWCQSTVSVSSCFHSQVCKNETHLFVIIPQMGKLQPCFILIA